MKPRKRTLPKKRPSKGVTPVMSLEEWERLLRADPNRCPHCGEPFERIVGCHKICSCGYQEGCGD